MGVGIGAIGVPSGVALVVLAVLVGGARVDWQGQVVGRWWIF